MLKEMYYASREEEDTTKRKTEVINAKKKIIYGNEVSLSVLIEQECREKIRKLVEYSSIVDVTFKPVDWRLNPCWYGKLAFHLMIATSVTLIFFIILSNSLISKWFSEGNEFLSSFFFLIILMLIMAILWFATLHFLKPRSFVVKENRYTKRGDGNENDGKGFFQLIPNSETISKELEPYITEATQKYVKCKVNEIIQECFEKTSHKQTYDIMDVESILGEYEGHRFRFEKLDDLHWTTQSESEIETSL
jgi:hypothetical protein